MVYAELGNSELALKALEKTQALTANSKNLSLRGYILAKSGHPLRPRTSCVRW